MNEIYPDYDPKWIITPRETTVIIPVADPANPRFPITLTTILENQPICLYIITSSRAHRREAEKVLSVFRESYPNTIIGLSDLPTPDKYQQLAHAMSRVETKGVVIASDSVYWTSQDTLRHILIPFRDHMVGVVTIPHVIRRTHPIRTWSETSVLNLCHCLRAARQAAFDRRNDALDGFTLHDDTTAAFRTQMFQTICPHAEWLTEQAVRKGWNIKHQSRDETLVDAAAPQEQFVSYFVAEIVRARAVWRGTFASFFYPMFWDRFPSSFLFVRLPRVWSFPLLWDAALVFLYSASDLAGSIQEEDGVSKGLPFWLLIAGMVAMDWIKVSECWKLSHFDLQLFACQILGTYLHSIIKLVALLTMWIPELPADARSEEEKRKSNAGLSDPDFDEWNLYNKENNKEIWDWGSAQVQMEPGTEIPRELKHWEKKLAEHGYLKIKPAAKKPKYEWPEIDRKWSSL
ncbi:hypothetical protein ACHAQH_001831 [Verticillium albo-atrum]